MGPTKKDLFVDDNDDSVSTSSDEYESSSDDSAASSSSSSSSSSITRTKNNITSITRKNDDNNGDDDDLRLTVNKKFATKYQHRKEREELQQTRQRRNENGDRGDSSSSNSSDEEEDEDGELFTPSVNVQFLKTIKALRKKDDSIYNPDAKFFDVVDVDVAVEVDENDDDDEDEDTRKTMKRKPQRYKDIVREQILQQIKEENNGGEQITKMNDNDAATFVSNSRSKLAYDEQQDTLRRAFLTESSKLLDSDGGTDRSKTIEGGVDDDEWMVVKKKVSVPELDLLEKEATEQLKEIENLSKNDSNKTEPDVFKDPRGEVQDGGKFLLDFIQNKKWIDKNDLDRCDDEDENDDDDDESYLDDVDRADDYEAQYNFRFEKAAEETANSGANLSVQTYARGQTMNTVRRQDTSRKDKREARKERKALERKAKEEQLKRLKNAKKQEMNQKVSKVKSVIGGIEENAVDEAAIMKMLEGDYDPENFEKALEEVYGDNFYKQEDNEWKTDLDVRQTLKDDDDGEDLVGQDDVNGGMYDNVQEERESGVNENSMEEGDYDESEEWADDDNDESHNESTLEKKLKTKIQEELYKLDYEDIVGGMPTRFKYKEVESNDYGLTTQEILFARDATLKQFVSLKNLAPYNEQGEYNAGSKKRRKFREMLKQDLEANQQPEKESQDDGAVNNGEATAEEPEPKKKRRRLKKGKKKSKDDVYSSVASSASKNTELSEKSAIIATETRVDTKPNLKIDDVANSNDTKKRRRKKNGKKRSSSSNKETTSEKGIAEKLDRDHKNEGWIENEATEQDLSEVDPKKYYLESVSASGEEKQKRKKKKNKKGKKGSIAGISNSRLASYGL